MLDLKMDPVCGMEIGFHEAVASAVTDGRRFYFCCLRCHAAFLDTPHRYVGWAGDPPRRLPARDGWSAPARAMSRTTSARGLEPCHFAS
ncbi:MAG: YHS domain-containing protein [Chloroflexi bacterium]|nr:YHS domain-containing protein [Chloroflexota bacterium]